MRGNLFVYERANDPSIRSCIADSAVNGQSPSPSPVEPKVRPLMRADVAAAGMLPANRDFEPRAIKTRCGKIYLLNSAQAK